MIVYGYLFGYLRLLKDTHHDEVFIEANGLVIKENGREICTYNELVAIARTELNLDKVTIIDYGDMK
ncbi:MAG: hypothetical protein IJF83_11135 [Methanobrevibacter sp.]|nr:hypothetical protein [Methanobrevibacter sp.]